MPSAQELRFQMATIMAQIEEAERREAEEQKARRLAELERKRQLEEKRRAEAVKLAERERKRQLEEAEMRRTTAAQQVEGGGVVAGPATQKAPNAPAIIPSGEPTVRR
jgi:hypothetical protein